MAHCKMVFILGDVHGDFAALNDFINTTIRMNAMLRGYSDLEREDGGSFEVVILQCGDFAWFWPDIDNKGKIKNEIPWLESGRVPLYFCGGNHEDWGRLHLLVPEGAKPEDRIAEVDAGIFYCGFGATLSLTPEKIVLFAGGAESTDKKERLVLMAQGYPQIWWPDEGISEADLLSLDDVPKADWVISHTAPLVFNDEMKPLPFVPSAPVLDISRERLDIVFRKYKPERWFFGHYHKLMRGEFEGCRWEALSAARGNRFWDKVFLEY